MRRIGWWAAIVAIIGVAAAGLAWWLVAPPPRPVLSASDAIAPPAWTGEPDWASAAERGAYLATAGGCASCHTASSPASAPLGGGREIGSPFGTFYGPNLTPHPEHGLGNWTEAQFAAAMRDGRRPDGAAYYPVFPYVEYSGMTDRDVSDLWAYLQTLEPAAQPNIEHDLSPPFSFRFLLPLWQALYFERGGPPIAEGQPDLWVRGAWLVEVMGHCAECHTPRTATVALDYTRHLAGAAGFDGRPVPDITAEGLAHWSLEQLTDYLETGVTPEGEAAGGEMAEVVAHNTAQLTREDREAIAYYLLTLTTTPPDRR